MAQTLNEADKGMEGCVMLALSTFRRSEKAVALAIEKCLEVKDFDDRLCRRHQCSPIHCRR